MSTETLKTRAQSCQSLQHGAAAAAEISQMNLKTLNKEEIRKRLQAIGMGPCHYIYEVKFLCPYFNSLDSWKCLRWTVGSSQNTYIYLYIHTQNLIYIIHIQIWLITFYTRDWIKMLCYIYMSYWIYLYIYIHVYLQLLARQPNMLWPRERWTLWR